jgi:hypothetical protein
MLTNMKPLLFIALIVLLQSCVKDIPRYKVLDDKLLLSKLSGQFNSGIFNGSNAFEFDQNGNFATNFVYGKKLNSFLKYHPLQQVTFIEHGSWDFVYDSWMLDIVADNSIPGLKLGDWPFTYDNKYQVKELEITKEALGLPSLHEYYTYNNKCQLTELIHGESKDNPAFKITYQYDHKGNLKGFDFYLGNGDDASAARKIVTGFRKNLEAVRKAARKNALSLNTYDLVFKATITSDNNNNPFSQQQNILFYLANRENIYFNDFFLKLMPSNPLQVKYVFTEPFGSSTIMQTFKYTYNNKKYPLTIEETEEDPDLWQFGDYTRSTKIEYIKND